MHDDEKKRTRGAREKFPDIRDVKRVVSDDRHGYVGHVDAFEYVTPDGRRIKETP